MTTLKKDFNYQDTESNFSDNSTLLNYPGNILLYHKHEPVRDTPSISTRRHSFSVPRSFHFNISNLTKILNKPYKNSRRLNPGNYHSLQDNECDGSNIYDSYIHYDDERSHRNNINSNQEGGNYKFLQNHSDEVVKLNTKMINDFWLNDNLPDELDFEMSSDEEDPNERK